MKLSNAFLMIACLHFADSTTILDHYQRIPFRSDFYVEAEALNVSTTKECALHASSKKLPAFRMDSGVCSVGSPLDKTFQEGATYPGGFELFVTKAGQSIS